MHGTRRIWNGAIVAAMAGLCWAAGAAEPDEAGISGELKSWLSEGAATVTEPAREVPVAHAVDVVVAGGGISGTFAALGAAQQGASVVLIERFESIGGTAGPGMNTSGGTQELGRAPLEDFEAGRTGLDIPLVWVYPELAGLPKRFAERVEALAEPGFNMLERSHTFSYVATEMLLEAGVTLMLGTFACDPIVEGNTVRGVFVENKSGRQAVLCKVLIDATGEADMARRAGAEVIRPELSYHDYDDRAPNGVGTWAYVGGIDWERHSEAMSSGEVVLTFDDFERLDIGDGLAQVAYWRKGNASLFGRVGDVGTIRVQLIRPHEKVNVASVADMTAIQVGVRKLIYELVRDFRERAPGCENAHVVAVAPYIANRGGPCIAGMHTLTMEECAASTRFDDVMYRLGEVRALRQDCADGECGWADVPYRVTVPVKLDGLLATGRCASCRPDTLLRNRVAVQHMGQAVGIAAAIAARRGLPPRDIDVRELQRALLADGFYLGDEARLSELGLTEER